VIVTGYGSAAALSEASRLRPVEMLTKPLDVARLRETVRGELQRQEGSRRVHRRRQQIRKLTRQVGRQQRRTGKSLAATCTELTATCRGLQARMDRQNTLVRYQTELLGCANEDETFSRFFRLFVQRSGPVFGVAMLCDENAELEIAGRFGVPVPDGVNFCQALALATVDSVLEKPEVRVLDASENLAMFPQAIHRLLVGVTLMLVPLMVGPGRMIGLVVLYRKGEQPFTADDVELAELTAPATAAAAQKT